MNLTSWSSVLQHIVVLQALLMACHCTKEQTIDSSSDVTNIDDDDTKSNDVIGNDDKRWAGAGDSRLWGKKRSDVTADDDVIKRTWSGEGARLWGKRSHDDDNAVDDDLNEDKRWSNDASSRVWGKRGDDDVDKKWNSQSRIWGKRAKLGWDVGDARVWGKRAWDGESSRVWGKRNSDDEDDGDEETESAVDKRKWGQSQRNWGKRQWGAADLDWGRRRRRSIDDDVDDDVIKRLWYAGYKRRWGKRNVVDDVIKRAWDDGGERLWGKRAPDDVSTWGASARQWGKRAWWSRDDSDARVDWGKRALAAKYPYYELDLSSYY